MGDRDSFSGPEEQGGSGKETEEESSGVGTTYITEEAEKFAKGKTVHRVKICRQLKGDEAW